MKKCFTCNKEVPNGYGDMRLLNKNTEVFECFECQEGREAYYQQLADEDYLNR